MIFVVWFVFGCGWVDVVFFVNIVVFVFVVREVYVGLRVGRRLRDFVFDFERVYVLNDVKKIYFFLVLIL